jgi:O-antigen/teichoic acid export membrane protein
MGWCVLGGGFLRFSIALVAVLALGWGSTGMMLGAGLSMALGLGYAVWQSRDLWSLPSERFDGRPVLKQVLPLIFGFWACQFLFTADTMFSKAYFSGEEMAPYLAAGTMSRALLWLVLPLAAVMFPKIVHSSAKAEKTDLLKIVLAGTAILAIFGALGLWLVAPIVVRIVYPASYVEAATRLLPWYAGAIVPLALANVLINDLLARGRTRVVGPVVFLAVAYGFTLPYILNHYPRKLETVLQTLGVFNLLLLAVAAWAAFGGSERRDGTVAAVSQD